MNSGQMFLSICGVLLLSMLILRINNNFLTTDQVMDGSKFGVLAVSLGTSIIEEASGKAFDAVTDTNSVSTLTSLTAPSGLGPQSGEVYPNFNDFDDFNNFVKIDSTMPSAIFKITCKVGYINTSNPDVFVNQRTWHKKIDVRVSSISMKDTIKLSSVFSYWHFR